MPASSVASAPTIICVDCPAGASTVGLFLPFSPLPFGRLSSRFELICAIAVRMALGFFSGALPDAARLACVLAFSTLGGVIPAAVFSGTTVHARTPQHIGTTNGMVMQSSHAAQFAIPILIAWVASRAGSWSASLQVMLALAVTGIVAALVVGRYERKL